MQLIVCNDIFDDRISNMADGEDNRRCSRCHRAQILSKCKDRPIVLNGTEIRILRVVQDTVVYELGSNDNIFSSLIRRASRLQGEKLD